jgi:excisionase family DNA binding protein
MCCGRRTVRIVARRVKRPRGPFRGAFDSRTVRAVTNAIDWISTGEAADYLGVQSRTLYRFIDEGRLPAYRFGRVIRLIRADVESFVQACRIEPGTLDAARHTGDVAATSSTVSSAT